MAGGRADAGTGGRRVQSHFVVFTPSGRRGSFAHGTSVLAAARSLGVDLDSVCGGRGICGRCQVEVGDGDFAKHAIVSSPAHLSQIDAVEIRHTDKRGPLKPGRRLGCQAQILGDLLIDVPAESQVHKQVVRKRAEAHPIAVDPVVRLYYVEVAEPDMHDPSSDYRRLCLALDSQHGIKGLKADLTVLSELQTALRRGLWQVTAAVRTDGTLVAVRPGYSDRALGVAVDIGSTTIAAHLCDLVTGTVRASAGLMNPQIRFGEDLMSRVSYVMMNPGGDRDLTLAVREAIDALVGRRRDRGRRRADGCPRDDRRRQSDHASPVPRARSDRTRRGAFRLDHRWRL